MDKVQIKYLFCNRSYDNCQETDCLSVVRGFHPSLICSSVGHQRNWPPWEYSLNLPLSHWLDPLLSTFTERSGFSHMGFLNYQLAMNTRPRAPCRVDYYKFGQMCTSIKYQFKCSRLNILEGDKINIPFWGLCLHVRVAVGSLSGLQVCFLQASGRATPILLSTNSWFLIPQAEFTTESI